MLPLVFYVFIDVIAFSSVIIAVLPFHVMFLGAGSITKWSDTIVHQLNNSGLKNEKIF